MSFISNDYINSIERGYGDSDKKLCHECIGNKSLKEYIKANGYVCTCDYCGQRRKAVNLDSFMVIIMSGVNFLYTHAVNELPCDSGEYIGKTYTTAQLIFEELRDEIDAQDERILKDIVEIISDTGSQYSSLRNKNKWQRLCNNCFVSSYGVNTGIGFDKN